jgi:hypothetical protein
VADVITRRVNKLVPRSVTRGMHADSRPRLPMAIDANERRDCDLEWNHFSDGLRADGQTDRRAR